MPAQPPSCPLTPPALQEEALAGLCVPVQEHSPCMHIPAAHSPFAPSRESTLRSSLPGSVPWKEAPAYSITQPPLVGLSQWEA